MMIPTVFAAHAATGVYYSKAEVLFLAPAVGADGNALQDDPIQTLAFASVVVHRFAEESPETAPRSTSAPLYGSGIRRGHLVYVPSSGGQWQLSFNRAVIAIEVVGESAEEVAAARDQIVNRISMLAKASQQEIGVSPANFITTNLDPSTASVSYAGVRNSRAEMALIFLTIGLAVGLPLVADRIIARIRARGSRQRTSVTGGVQDLKHRSGPPPQRENELAPPLA
ncbi:MAG: hypothetical protein NTU93_09960 [Arthrobacter sp.]|nr:hypothetical protein [Arthrobacter sp.]